MASTVRRPLWRAFAPRELTRAAKHARAGGISVVKDRRWYLLGDAGPAGEDVPLFVDWALRAIESETWEEQVEGDVSGLIKATVTADWRERVGEWIARDADFRGSSANSKFDCVKCAACCVDNKVLLDRADVARLRAGGAAIGRSIRTVRGKRYLPLAPPVESMNGAKPCVHLRELKCGIYPHRPFMCRDFPAGTEQCMTSREDLYGSPFPKGR